MKKITKQEALDFHAKNPKGKVSMSITKELNSKYALSIAYSPGVAYPCLEIEKDPAMAYEYTSKGNLVAMISNGTAVLGLGDIGALASKPVMEGKSCLLKKFGKCDSVDVLVDTKDVAEFVNIVSKIALTYGAINLEDIKAPECFEIEKRLQNLGIPVFHDDQHGTAIVVLAGVINSCLITGKKIQDLKLVVNGAGAAAIACTNLLVEYGLPIENVTMCDSKGVIYEGRDIDINPWKGRYAKKTNLRTLADTLHGADMFLGLSVAGSVTKDMLKTMAKNPIVFAMANPNPEILPEDAKEVRIDVIMATGRSDYPNQINNVLCFPYLFRGLLDSRATKVTTEMKIAMSEELAKIAQEEMTQQVIKANDEIKLEFGREYIIPNPFDERLFERLPKRIIEICKNDK